MPEISTVTDLKSQLEQAVQNGTLDLTSGFVPTGKLANFLNTLPEQRISLQQPALVLSEPPDALTVAGHAGEDWEIRGTAGKSVRLKQVTITFTKKAEDFEAQLGIDGTIQIGAAQIEVSGTLGDNNQLDFRLKQASVISHSLSEIADFISQNTLAAFMPAGIEMFDVVPVSALDFSFGFGRTAVTKFSFTSDMNAEWQIIDNWASLKKVGLTLDAESGFKPVFQHSIGGNIHAALHLDRDYTVRIGLRGQNNWQAELIPSNGNVLPGLSTLAGLAGGESLKSTVRNGLENLGLSAIAIDGVLIGFNPVDRTLEGFQMQGHITVEEMTFLVRVFLPNFEFYGILSPGTPMHLRELIGKHFAGAEAFPEIDISQLEIYAQPGAGRYQFNVSITGNPEIQIGTIALGFTRLDLNINKEAGVITGFIDGQLKLADTELEVTARQGGLDVGWQFEAASEPGQEIPIGKFLEDLAAVFGVPADLPSPIAKLTIENFDVSFDTKTENFKFSCESKFPIAEKEVDILVTIDLTKKDNKYDKKFGGQITVGDLQFDINFDKDNDSNVFIATYTHSGSQQNKNVRDLVAEISSGIAGYVPDKLEIELKDALFAFIKNDADTKFLFGLDVGTSINLSNLPLVGKELSSNQTVSVDDLRLLVASKPLNKKEVKALNKIIKIIPRAIAELPESAETGDNQANDGDNSAADADASIVINDGFSVSAQINFGGDQRTLSLTAGGKNPAETTGETTRAAAKTTQLSTPDAAADASSSPADNVHWFTVQKNFGPVHFERVGVQYKDAVLSFLLDAALSAAGLTLSLEGLSIGSPLNKFSPQFNLHGLGIDYQAGEVEIGGEFLRTGGANYDEYSGAAIIKTKQFSLSAIGSYAKPDGHPSLFVYGVLNYPIGGPSFFFVTGLAAGFGYNRSLKVPPVEAIAQFPLVAEAVNGSGTPNQLTQEIQLLRDYIPPAIGEVFVAVGVRFTSFKMIDSFALLTFSFGSRFEMNLLGLSTLIVPTPVAGEPPATPLAEAQMALKATFIPDEGFLGVSAQLTSASYILSRECHLTGGYAFYSWFSGEHEGDFVQTLGGYHPSFNVPAHYPKVPRLGFNWRVSDSITIKGELYYALTANALMAGGCLKAVWEDGDLSAWFDAGADFLISWKPYHYDARIYVDMGVSYYFNLFGRHHISVDIGADLHIWGPEFSGHAHIHLWIVSFDVSFGDSSPEPEPIDWATFRDSFLPREDEKISGVVVKDGLVKSTNDKHNFGIINPKHFSLVTNSVIPSNDARIGNGSISNKLGKITPIGIGSMQVAPDKEKFSSTHNIKITRRERDDKGVEKDDSVEKEFEFTPILKNVPAGLWGKDLTPDLNGQALIENALTGYEIVPKASPTPGESKNIDRKNLQYAAPRIIEGAFNLKPVKAFFSSEHDDEAQRRQSIKDGILSSAVVSARNQFLQALGISATDINLSETVADEFLVAPMIEP